MNIICVGRNYVDHIKELNNNIPENPVIFFKPETSLNESSQFKYPSITNNLHYEVELVFKIKKEGKNIKKIDAKTHIDSIGIGIDFTARDIQSIDKDELKFILGDNIKIAVEESTSPLKLQTDELSVNGKNSIIMTDQIQLRPMRSRPKRFSVGSLYYNRGKKTFEFHDGKKWRTLVKE